MEEVRGNFSRVPQEILNEILSYLPIRDKKSLREVSSFFANTIEIRIPRVFLSANPRNIDVIKGIADDKIRRHYVEELIWDDSLLVTPADCRTMRVRSDYYQCLRIPYRPPKLALIQNEQALLRQSLGELDEFHELYAKACAVNLCDVRARRGNDRDTPAHLERDERIKNVMPTLESIRYYMDLVNQQERVISTGEHILAFRIALHRFPNLRKVTITPVCHGFLFTPLYETPMIRSFPKGFNYPIPRAWPSYLGKAKRCETTRWPAFRQGGNFATKWNGVRVVLQVLALQKNRVTEFEINARGLDQGVPIDIFDPVHDEQRYLTTVIGNLSHLTLSIEVSPETDSIEQKGRFVHEALSRNPNLTHFSFHCNAPSFEGLFPPLRTWTQLQHFGLTGFHVMVNDLVEFLSFMPDTLRSLELGFLLYGTYWGSYCEILQDMRDQLGWGERPEDDRPKIVLRVNLMHEVPGRHITADKEVEDFIYGDGPNPFGSPDDRFLWNHLTGRGILHDEFDPAYERPNLPPKKLAALGITKDARDIESSPFDSEDFSEDFSEDYSEEDELEGNQD
ncbi:unnamed protein product [Clonostachys rosea]|uniref:F-box domain-containing protein n=1 Tax=Bionectria ochroleuca TaxID=29856 RepID=A0ABY6USJ1_BIOOC|nr:unnamed protein product [Clonostachys rosea]